VEAATRDPDYAPYADGPGGPFRWRLGLRPLDLHDWIEIGERYEADLARKREVRDRFGDTVFVALPAAHDACAEVCAALVDHLVTRWPGDFTRTVGGVVNHRTGERLPIDGDLHPLEVASRLVQEDLIVMAEAPAGEHAGELVFAAGSVCFPNRWDLPSKLGLPLAAVHAPVSQLNDQLGDPIAKFFDRLTPTRSYWRLGWGVLDTDDLYQPTDGTAAARPGRVTLDDLYVRVERETLRRFPRTGCVLFTIRTYLRTLREVAADPERLGRLAEVLASMPDDVARYKQLEAIRPGLAELFERPV
jgi:hypothetical protein